MPASMPAMMSVSMIADHDRVLEARGCCRSPHHERAGLADEVRPHACRLDQRAMALRGAQATFRRTVRVRVGGDERPRAHQANGCVS
jgi:hypothetical protein